MSWLRSSPLRQSLSRNTTQPRPGSDCDPKACYDSFCRHWFQSSEIITKSTEVSSYFWNFLSFLSNKKVQLMEISLSLCLFRPFWDLNGNNVYENEMETMSVCHVVDFKWFPAYKFAFLWRSFNWILNNL